MRAVLDTNVVISAIFFGGDPLIVKYEAFMRKLLFVVAAACCVPMGWAVDWDKALITGSVPGDRVEFRPGEKMEFVLKLQGVSEPLPADTYFVDWERRGDDGLKEKGRAPLPFPPEGLKLTTKMETPGFVCIEANVVTKDGKRVPKNHRWEKRVFFQGGAGVDLETIGGGKEPADYLAYWKKAMAELDAVPVKADVVEVPIADKAVRLYSVRIACAGPRPVTAYLTVPADAGRRYPTTVCYRGASHDNMRPPAKGPHDRIRMEVTVQGFDLGKDDAYVKEFFKSICRPGFEYGFAPDDLKDRDTCYWKWVILRAVRTLQWVTTRPEWNGEELVLDCGSQGAWQALHAASHFHRVTQLKLGAPWGCDWTGQKEVANRLNAGYRPRCWFPAMAYFDPVFAAKRIRAATSIVCGLGDYVSPPSSLTAVYNNLNVPKKIVYDQGCTHGWHPSGMAHVAVDGGYDRWLAARKVCADPVKYIETRAAAGEKLIRLPKAQYWLTPEPGRKSYLTLEGLADVTVDFGGSEFVGTIRTRMLTVRACTNCTFRNLTIDYATLPFTQGVITNVDSNRNWDVEIVRGYPIPPWNEFRWPWPVQAYGAKTHELVNPMRFRDGISVTRTGPRTCRITGGKDRRGEKGDIAVWSIGEPAEFGAETCAQHAQACKSCRFEDITEYATPMGCAYRDYFGDDETYLRCRIVRRPPERDLFPRGMPRLRSGNHDANMHRGAIRGPRIVDCEAKYHCDDCVNIGGMFGVVTRQDGNRARVVFNYLGPSIDAGDECEAVDPERRRIPNPKALRLGPIVASDKADIAVLEKAAKLWPGLSGSCKRAMEIEFDRPIGVGGFVISTRHQGNGFLVQGCDFGHNRARGLILSGSNGTVVSNRIEATCGTPAEAAGPSFLWMEGGFSRNIRCEGNTFKDLKVTGDKVR